MVDNEVVKKSKFELVDSIPKVLIYSGTSFVIWMFTKFLFVPLGDIPLWGNLKASMVIVSISVVTILVIVLKILKEIRDICDAIAGLAAYAIDKNTSSTEAQIYQYTVRSLAYVLVVAVMFLLFGSLLSEIHPALSGIVLIVVFFWSIGTLYNAGMMLSDKIEPKIKRITTRLLSLEAAGKTKE